MKSKNWNSRELINVTFTFPHDFKFENFKDTAVETNISTSNGKSVKPAAINQLVNSEENVKLSPTNLLENSTSGEANTANLAKEKPSAAASESTLFETDTNITDSTTKDSNVSVETSSSDKKLEQPASKEPNTIPVPDNSSGKSESSSAKENVEGDADVTITDETDVENATNILNELENSTVPEPDNSDKPEAKLEAPTQVKEIKEANKIENVKEASDSKYVSDLNPVNDSFASVSSPVQKTSINTLNNTSHTSEIVNSSDSDTNLPSKQNIPTKTEITTENKVEGKSLTQDQPKTAPVTVKDSGGNKEIEDDKVVPVGSVQDPMKNLDTKVTTDSTSENTTNTFDKQDQIGKTKTTPVKSEEPTTKAPDEKTESNKPKDALSDETVPDSKTVKDSSEAVAQNNEITITDDIANVTVTSDDQRKASVETKSHNKKRVTKKKSQQSPTVDEPGSSTGVENVSSSSEVKIPAVNDQGNKAGVDNALPSAEVKTPAVNQLGSNIEIDTLPDNKSASLENATDEVAVASDSSNEKILESVTENSPSVFTGSTENSPAETKPTIEDNTNKVLSSVKPIDRNFVYGLKEKYQQPQQLREHAESLKETVSVIENADGESVKLLETNITETDTTLVRDMETSDSNVEPSPIGSEGEVQKENADKGKEHNLFYEASLEYNDNAEQTDTADVKSNEFYETFIGLMEYLPDFSSIEFANYFHNAFEKVKSIFDFNKATSDRFEVEEEFCREGKYIN